MLYFSYKYYVPWSGGQDYAQYYAMYQQPLDMSQTQAPFIYRQFGAVITHVIYKLGLYYPNEIHFIDAGYDQRIFFSALLSNYLALFLTSILVAMTVARRFDYPCLFPPLVGGLLCFLSFFTQQNVITGLSEGWSWFLMALVFYAYESRRQTLMIAVLILSIFQREILPIVVAVLSGVALWQGREKAHRDPFVVTTFVSAGFAFALYVLVRSLILPVDGHETQLAPLDLWSGLLESVPPSASVLMQGVVSQNIFFIFLVTALFVTYLRKRTGAVGDFETSRNGVVQLVVMLLAVYLIGMAAQIGHNIGRIASLITPVVAVYAALNLAAIEQMLSGERVRVDRAVRSPQSFRRSEPEPAPGLSALAGPPPSSPLHRQSHQ